MCLSRGPPVGNFAIFKFGDQEHILDDSTLEKLCVLGLGAHGLVEKMRHTPSGAVMAVKVNNIFA